MIAKIKCPECGIEGSFSLSDVSYEGPYRCWKCKALFTIKMENKELKPIECHKKVKSALDQLKDLKKTSKKNKKLDNAIERVSSVNLRICKDFLGLDFE